MNAFAIGSILLLLYEKFADFWIFTTLPVWSKTIKLWQTC